MNTNDIRRSVQAFVIVSIIIIVVISPVWVSAQNAGIISGYVKDRQTREPLEMVNVFLDGTSYGWATNKEGFYEIKNIPPGMYTLVFTMIGYAMEEIKIDLRSVGKRRFDMDMNSEVLVGQEVVVTGEVSREWEENLKKFKDAFFGISTFASDCELMNPEVLDFRVKKSSYPQYETLYAETCQPLIFINNALGYEVHYHIVEFEASLTHGKLLYIGDTIEAYGAFKMIGKTRYIPLNIWDQKLQKKYRKNRKKVYDGSLRHFFVSLASGSEKEGGFKIFNTNTGKKINRSDIMRVDSLTNNYILDLANAGADFKSGFQKIIDVHNRKGFYRTKKTHYRDSQLVVKDGAVIEFTKNGVAVSDVLDFEFLGYWRWSMSAAEWLPDNYVVTPKRVAVF